MVGAPNARTKVDNQQTAELNGNPGVDTHFVEFTGESGTDTRAVTLEGEVTDTHDAQLDGESSVTLNVSNRVATDGTLSVNGRFNRVFTYNLSPSGNWVTIMTHNRGSPGEGNSVLVSFIGQTSAGRSQNDSVFSISYRIIKNNTDVLSSGSYFQWRTRMYGFIAHAIDDNTNDEGATYVLQFRFPSSSIFPLTVWVFNGSLNSAIISRTSDTHSAVLGGTEGIDTHMAVLEGSTAQTLEPKLIGSEGIDTHHVILNGNSPSATFSSLQSITLTPPLYSGLFRAQTRGSSQDVPIISTSINADSDTSNIVLMLGATYFIWNVDTRYSVSWLLRRNDGVVFTQGSDTAQGTEGKLGFVDGVFFDNSPLIGTNTYEFFVWRAGHQHPFSGGQLRAITYDITDTHEANLIGENIDTHAYQLSGSVTPDTHAVTLQGSPPVDTHSVNLIGNVRGKSPIGGRLR